MHTSARLSATDFQFWSQENGQRFEARFDQVCPDYHSLDRVGLVSPYLADGVFGASYAILALATTFYDVHRARSVDFFAYPQHFAVVGQTENRVHTQQGTLSMAKAGVWAAWSWLDVWPAAKWITASATASAMLKQIFDHQINVFSGLMSLSQASMKTCCPTPPLKCCKPISNRWSTIICHPRWLQMMIQVSSVSR